MPAAAAAAGRLRSRRRFCRRAAPRVAATAMVDFVGQKLSEDIYTYVITGASVVAFLAGYATACAPAPSPGLRAALRR